MSPVSGEHRFRQTGVAKIAGGEHIHVVAHLGLKKIVGNGDVGIVAKSRSIISAQTVGNDIIPLCGGRHFPHVRAGKQVEDSRDSGFH